MRAPPNQSCAELHQTFEAQSDKEATVRSGMGEERLNGEDVPGMTIQGQQCCLVYCVLVV